MRMTTVRTSEKIYCQLKKVAKERGISMNAMVTTILYQYLFGGE